MTTLERLIREHAGFFNDEEPEPDHFSRFNSRLDRLHASGIGKNKPVQFWLNIAAGILVLLTAGLAIYELSTRDFSHGSKLQQTTAGLSDEIIEVLTIYRQRSDQQLEEIHQLAQNCPGRYGIMEATKNQVARFERNLDELVTALKKNPSNTRLQAALIQNCKARENFLCDLALQGKIQKCE